MGDVNGGPAIVGTGFAVPPQVRTNDDPIYDRIPKHQDMFYGYDQRRVLGPGESVGWLMIEAGQAALKAAGVHASAVDILLGYGTVSEWLTPNVLAHVHAELGLPGHAPALPLADDFTNFNSGLVVADALIRTGRAGTALIVCGDNWTQHVDYSTPAAFSAADAAGAAVLSASTDAARWRLLDQQHLTVSDEYGAMYMAETFHITPAGAVAFNTFGARTAPTVAEALIERHGLDPHAVTLITHQASQKLIDAWQARPGLAGSTFLNTILQYGNPALAGVPLTLAARGGEVSTDHLILFCLGVQQQASAVLLGRQPRTSSTLAAAPQSA